MSVAMNTGCQRPCSKAPQPLAGSFASALHRHHAAHTPHVCKAQASEPQVRKPQAPSAPSKPSSPTEEARSNTQKGVTVDFQRKQAKALQQFFRESKAQQAAEGRQLFGWTKGNEILNGRWVMFGLMVGLLTEYATSVNFPDQIKLLLSYLGIADFFD